jgi:hypothetical protein
MDDHFDVRMLLDDRAGASGVIEVNMRHQDLAHVAETNPLLLERRRQRGDRRRRTGIDERDAGRPMQDPRRDDLGPPEEVEIDVIEARGENRHP